MRTFRMSERRYLLQLEHGEEVKETLRAFADEHRIGVGALRGLGAAERAELDFYYLAEQRHEGLSVNEATEVAGLVGTLSRGERGEPVPHVHATLCRADRTTVGGHLRSLVVGATLEIDLEIFPGTVQRQLDPRVGLPLLHSHERPDDG